MLVGDRDQYWTMASLLGCVILSLFWSLVHSQTFPYVSFMGQTLANHSYVDLSTVGSDSVQCHTDLSTCCSSAQGYHRGDWCFPDRTRLPFSGIVYERRGAQRVDLRRTTTTGPTGIYRCDIPTHDVHDDTDISVRDTVYVGLYIGSGGRCSPLLKLLCLWCKMPLASVVLASCFIALNNFLLGQH